MSEIIDIQIKDDGNLEQKLLKKAGEIGPRIVHDVNDMLLTIENNVKFVTHRGQHCKGKGGTTKSAIKHQLNNNGGFVFVDESIAPWAHFYIDGRGAVTPVNAKVLRFCIDNKVIFTRKVKAWKGHDIMKEGMKRSLPVVEQKANNLGRWIEKV